ncbi:bifunctional diaminohydroxyphosphoribosylaminopyrimidine deaminase/5-amino-6-(5-phosphoribosylamino)uracil reductase RibD [Ideonella sp. A 288]|uniref:bifunctional diaminohydroxyphosphoribosylaminopyrimidine deaminase/5-amino-6-(5-phosphoribosylamino)uracil reductase RibD n=1 Tax=Ideonella sp. A 288 TaxID=1962181 RepID=UPI000B4A6686|nr:bifunctional diaminohydroxyphosphoribosylaminopyrimidine deaminase/5-amino-6-(5-phosphoribosylamino)uracil reductase RibD [Ideonella sp. A 288]
MSFGALDLGLLHRAVELAHQSIGLSEPNPRVGCVLHTASGQLAAEGFTQEAGGPHAEAHALRVAATAGHDVRGGTAWVSLEPCAHHGRTPPCCDALIAAGLARVVVAITDPFPQVAGQGLARLRAAGIEVVLAPPCAAVDAARELNLGFLSRVLRQRPWVRLKIAASLDGRTALADGRSQWITGIDARTDGHRWRKRAGAILTGIGTVLDDDPRLDVRLVPTERQPRRIVVDPTLRLPLEACVLPPPGDTLVVHADAPAERVAALAARGATLESLPGPEGRIDLHRLMTRLGETGVNELHVEAGATLSGALLQAGLVDELLVYLAPKLLGPGRDMAVLPPLASLDQAPSFLVHTLALVGDDVRLVLRPAGRADFAGR